MLNKKHISTLAASAMCLVITGVSHAQNRTIEEVTVTAAKKEQTLQEIPVAVSVISGDAIEKAQILDLSDLQSIVPSLRINTLQNSANTNFIIRGFGNGANNPGIEPSVGVFIDGVYRSRSAAQIGDLPNLERVEVLRGPQSTLFGKNASAGVISVVTRAPDGESRGKISATVGNYDQTVFKAQVEGGLTDNIAFDLSGSFNNRNGYIKNEATGSDLNDRDRMSLRGQLVFNPSDDTRIRVIADYDTIDEVCCGVNNIVQSPLEVFINSQTGAQVNANQPLALSVQQNSDPTNEITNKGVSVQLDQNFNSFALTSITSFRKVNSKSSIDADFTTGAYLTNPIATDIETFTQEVRLTSTGDGAIDWMIGGFYFDEKIDYENRLDYGNDFRSFIDALTIAPGPAPAPGTYPLDLVQGASQVLGLIGPTESFYPAGGILNELGTLDNQAFSFFAQTDWNISETLTATFGINYTDDEKKASLVQPNQDVFGNLDLVEFGAAYNTIQGTSDSFPSWDEVGGLALGTHAAICNAGVNPNGAAYDGSSENCNFLLPLSDAQFLNPLQGYPNAVEDGKSHDDKLTYAFRLAAEVNDFFNVYASVSTGFKATSWNLSRDSSPSAATIAALGTDAVNNVTPGTRFAGPEDAKAYELGLKANFDRGSLNVAIFDQSIKGFQSNVFLGTGFNLVNAGEQSSRGIEFDLAYYPVDALRLTLAGTLLDPEYDEFEGAAVPRGSALDANDGIPDNSIGSLTGETPAGIHEVSLSASATYSFTLPNGLDAYVRGDYQYEDEVQTNDNVPKSVATEDLKNLNLSAGISTEAGLAFSVWGRNVTDHESVTTAFPTVANTRGYYGYRNQPRTYGVTVSYDIMN
ncbi:TonB-dependent receptor [Pseudomonadales bacterium]|nr:TonB-dependent receptor [Pseudomonadales bacterium]